MARTHRLLVVALAVVALGVAFVVLRGAGDDDGTTATAPSTPAAETSAAPASETAPEPERPPPPRVERVRIRGGQPAGDVRTISFDSGDSVRLRFSSDRAVEIHIHGYDRYVNVPAGGSASTRFRATAEGVFEIESHDTGALLARLRVEP
jgi:hypothetical protein